MRNKVLDFFYEIMNIPRESGNETAMVEFLKNFAIKNNLAYVVDEYKNVLIKKHTKNSRPLILQAHTDMVCVSEENLKVDFAKNAIIPVIDDNILHAKGTSLGADNGIGISMILSLLQENFPMNIEAIFTSEEETTTSGAKNFEINKLEGKHLLSLDGSEESVIEIASASSLDLEFNLNKKELNEINDNLFSLEVSGLIGGHSGQDIDKHRGHAFKILFKFLSLVGDIRLVDFQGNVKPNVIPTNAKVIFETKLSYKEISEILTNYYEDTFMHIYSPKLKIELKEESKQNYIYSFANSNELLHLINKLDYEVIKEDNEGFVLLSANLYKIDLKNSKIYMSIRGSSKEVEKPYLLTLQLLADAYNVTINKINYLPPLEFKEKSELRELLIQTHIECYKTQPILKKIHAGLEAGIFSGKNNYLDINVIGAQIYDLHSTKERVELDSVDRTYEWLKLTVQKFN